MQQDEPGSQPAPRKPKTRTVDISKIPPDIGPPLAFACGLKQRLQLAASEDQASMLVLGAIDALGAALSGICAHLFPESVAEPTLIKLVDSDAGKN